MKIAYIYTTGEIEYWLVFMVLLNQFYYLTVVFDKLLLGHHLELS